MSAESQGFGISILSEPKPNDRESGLQPVDGTAGGAVYPSLYRSGLCVQRVQPADDEAVGITQSAPGDWKPTEIGWIFSIAIFFLGTSAAVMGRWVEEGGPRRAMFAAALCFGCGFVTAGPGVSLHNL